MSGTFNLLLKENKNKESKLNFRSYSINCFLKRNNFKYAKVITTEIFIVHYVKLPKSIRF